MGTILFAGLLLGLSSSLHCIGMCGPIAMAIPVNRKNNWTLLSGVLQYNLGRVLVYSLLGAFVGSIGLTVQSFGVLQIMSIVVGILLIIWAWRKWLGKTFHLTIPSGQINGWISQSIGKVLRGKFLFKLPLLGALNGLLPCGMVYIALMSALLAGSPLASAATMALFGLGTVPAMLFVGFAAGKVTGSLRLKLNQSVPYVMTVVGLLVILRGMNLGIPMISPKAEKVMEKTGQCQQPKEEMKMECCHVK